MPIVANDDDEILYQNFTMAAGAASVLPFVPLHGATDCLSRRYFFGPMEEESFKFFVNKIETGDKMQEARMELVGYVPSVYTDAAPSPYPSAAITSLGTANNATSLAVVETSTQDGQSTLTVSWTGAAGAAAYNVFSKVGNDADNWQFQGVTATTSIAFLIEQTQGTPVVIMVQTIATNGGRTTLNDLADVAGGSPTITYVLRRDTDGQTLIVYPDTPGNVTVTPGASNTAVLDWAAVTLDTNGDAITVTGYEVRVGEWNRGAVIYKSTASQCDLVVPRVHCLYQLRAYKTQAGQDWSSPDAAQVTIDGTASAYELTGYTTASYPAAYVDLEADVATLANANPIHWDGVANERALLQIVNDQRLEIVTTPIDLGSAALTQVSIAPRFLTWMRDNGGFFWMSDQNRSSSGPINQNLTKWTLDLQYSTGGGYTNWRSATNGSAGESLNQDIIESPFLFFDKRAARNVTNAHPNLGELIQLFNVALFGSLENSVRESDVRPHLVDFIPRAVEQRLVALFGPKPIARHRRILDNDFLKAVAHGLRWRPKADGNLEVADLLGVHPVDEKPVGDRIAFKIILIRGVLPDGMNRTLGHSQQHEEPLREVGRAAPP